MLAESYSVYLKTHNFHWNVTGPMFQTLHLMFETHYNELALAVDLVAERIRALGHFAPGTYREFTKLSSIPEVDGVPAATDMIRELIAGHQTVTKTARSVFAAAEAAADQATMGLLTQSLQVHEKTCLDAQIAPGTVEPTSPQSGNRTPRICNLRRRELVN